MASVDKGTSVKLAVTEPKISPAGLQIGQPSNAQGQYRDPQQLATLVPIHDRQNINTTLLIPGLTGGGVQTTHFIFYKMQGWYSAGSVFEAWTSVNVPNFSPPSGHALSDIAIVGVLRT